MKSVAAVDLGATSGRVILGEVGPGELRMHTVARFPNTPVELPDGLHWNIVELYRSILDGLRDAGRETQRRSGAQLQSIGIDSWAVSTGDPSRWRPSGASRTTPCRPPAACTGI